METDRRGFLRVLASAVALLSGRAGADPIALPPEIHRATRNTGFGAVGRRRPTGPMPPRKHYPGRSRIALPKSQRAVRRFGEVVRGYQAARGFDPSALSVADLAALLFLTNGATGAIRVDGGTIDLRAAPSAGALYAGEVYALVERVDGLAPGLYYYAVGGHRLVQLRAGALLGAVSEALEFPDEIENAAAVVLLTNVFGRYTARYANRGYRYALIDSGHIGENLRLAASSAGLSDASPLRFRDDALNDLLEIDGRSEAVCALHAIGRSGERGTREPVRARRFTEQQRAGTTGRSQPAEFVTDRYHDATRLVPGDLSAPRPAPPDPTRPPKTRIGTALPAPQSSAMTVERAILERRSAEGFTPRGVTLGQLSSVLEAADGIAALERTAGVEIFAVVHRVVGLEPGVYRHAPRAHRLDAIRPGRFGGRLRRACLRQKNAETAAVGLVMAARLDGAAAPLGDRRYRDLLIESGAVAQRIYLAAGTVGLVARNLAAFVDDRVNALLGLDALGLFALHLTMLGHGTHGR